MADRRARRIAGVGSLLVALSLCAGCALTTSDDGTAPNGEPGATPNEEQPSATPASTADSPSPVSTAAPVPTAPEPGAPIPTQPVTPGREATCGVDWNNERASVPDEHGIVGTFNGRPFALALEQVHVELDCHGATGQPPALHFGFTLEEEGLVFVIRRCDGIAYLPDSTGVALETDPTETLATVSAERGLASGGRFRLTGRETPDSEELELEFTLSVPIQASNNPVPICPG
jgi:hypothetical protein